MGASVRLARTGSALLTAPVMPPEAKRRLRMSTSSQGEAERPRTYPIAADALRQCAVSQLEVRRGETPTVPSQQFS